MSEYKSGDQVLILVGGPHENFGRIATVSCYRPHTKTVTLYFGDRDEDEYIYGVEEVRKVIKRRSLHDLVQEYRPTMDLEVVHDWAREVISVIERENSGQGS